MPYQAFHFLLVHFLRARSSRHFLVSLSFMSIVVSFDRYYYIDVLSPATQYCDGLRGAFIVYDPSDPHASL